MNGRWGRRTPRAGFVLLLALLLAVLPALGMAGAAQLRHAGLVVRSGDGRLTYAYVAFPEETISGVELLRRSGLPLVTTGFGGLGEAICTIGDQGCGPDECRARMCQGPGSDGAYWQYFRQQSPGDWRSLSLGASATKVGDGTIDGWSWTGRDPLLPAVTLADVARQVGAENAPPPSDGSVPTAAVRTIAPPGAPAKPTPPTGWTTYVGAGVILAAIAVGALAAAKRRPPPRGGSA